MSSHTNSVIILPHVPGVKCACRKISLGDENRLLPAEATDFDNCSLIVRRRSGAARHTARLLLAHFDHKEVIIRRGAGGAPIWPRGIVGSLSHTDDLAVAAIARQSAFGAIGIDVEPNQPLPTCLLDSIATSREKNLFPRSVLETRLLFSIKEAVYKASYPTLGRFLDFQDVEVASDLRSASVLSYFNFKITYVATETLIVLAYQNAPEACLGLR
jgi:4'-phosphopantetheinyl transferase EntD